MRSGNRYNLTQYIKRCAWEITWGIRMIKFIQCFILLFFVSFHVTAGTVVEIESDGELTTVMTDGKQARMNTSTSEYVIVNYKNNDVKFINPSEKEVMLLTGDDIPVSSKKAAVIKTSIKNLGSGPVIAGYKTEKFSYLANDKDCGVLYGSKKAYQTKGISELFDAMKAMVDKQRAIMGNYAHMMDDCTRADMNISDYVSTTGVPMRTENNGRVTSEIKSIKVGVSLSADVFEIPTGYKVVKLQDKMNEMSAGAAKAQKEMQQYQPQMQEMMKRMQQSGQMTPEMMEQMRQAQEMMKQYQQ